MRKKSIALLLGCTVIACHDSTVGPSKSALDEATANALVARGFDVTSAVDLGTYVLVEGDILLQKSELRATRTSTRRHQDSRMRPGGPQMQWATTSYVYSSKATQIRVNLAGLAADTGWQNAARRAMASWSNIYGVDISMTEGSPADITMQFGACPSGCVAYASFPSGGNPGPTITIDSAYNWEPAAMKQAFVTHELGHTIGLRHTDLVANGESTSGAYQLRLTPTTDAASLMNHVVTSSNSVLSARDSTAARDLFPTTVQNVHAVSYPLTLAWDAVPGAAQYEVYYRFFEDTYDQDGTPSTQEYRYLVGTTTATSFYSSDPYTGNSSCYHEYLIFATFSDGTSSREGGSGPLPIC